MDMSLSKLWEIVKGRGTWHAAVHEVTKSQTWLSNWTTKHVPNWLREPKYDKPCIWKRTWTGDWLKVKDISEEVVNKVLWKEVEIGREGKTQGSQGRVQGWELSSWYPATHGWAAQLTSSAEDKCQFWELLREDRMWAWVCAQSLLYPASLLSPVTTE